MTFLVDRHFHKDTEEYRKAYAFARNCMTGVLAYPIFNFLKQDNPLYNQVSVMPFLFLNLTALTILYYKGNLGLCVNLIAGGLLWLLTDAILKTGGMSSHFFMWLMLSPICALTVGNLKKGIFWSIATILSSIVIFLIDTTPFNAIYKETDKFPMLLNYIFYFSALLSALMSYERLKERQRNIIAKQLEDLLEQRETLTQKNVELERFAYIASHDLKTPLRNIISFTGLLNRKLKLSEDTDIKQYMSFIQDYAYHMTHIVEDILEFAKINKPEYLTLVDLEDVKNNVIASLKEKIEKSNACILGEDRLPHIKGDRTHFIQVMQNLIDNALTYNEKPQPLITIGLGKDAENGTYIYVKDNGIGIDDQYQDKVFEMFTRLHSIDKYPGTGLGLAICKKIVLQHGGRIWIDSTLHKGTTVNFILPMAA